MKVEWDIEGTGCNQARCGLKTFKVEIPDEEIEGMNDTQRDKFIDDWIQEEFTQNIYHSGKS